MYDVYCVLNPMYPEDAMIHFTKGEQSINIRNKQIIHSDNTPLEDHKLLEPVIEMERGVNGKMTFRVPPHNHLYEYIQDNSTFFVEENGELIFDGQLRHTKKDFNRNNTIEVEGCLGYLNDTWLPLYGDTNDDPNVWAWDDLPESAWSKPWSYEGMNIYGHMYRIIAGHNHFAPAYKRFDLGYIDETIGVSPNYHYYILFNYESPMYYMNQLKSTFGGYFKVSYMNGRRRLDYMKDDMSNLYDADQTITFGVNLFDYVEELDMTNFYTVVKPFGAEYKDGQGNTRRHDICSVNDGKNDLKVSDELLQRYGYIPKRIFYDDIGRSQQPSTDVSMALKLRAAEDMSNQKLKNIKITVTAEDLHYLDTNIKRLTTSSKVRIISRPHNVDIMLPCSKIKIDLANPSASKYELTNSEENVNYKDVFVKNGNTTLSALMSMVYKKGQNIK